MYNVEYVDVTIHDSQAFNDFRTKLKNIYTFSAKRVTMVDPMLVVCKHNGSIIVSFSDGTRQVSPVQSGHTIDVHSIQSIYL